MSHQALVHLTPAILPKFQHLPMANSMTLHPACVPHACCTRERPQRTDSDGAQEFLDNFNSKPKPRDKNVTKQKAAVQMHPCMGLNPYRRVYTRNV